MDMRGRVGAEGGEEFSAMLSGASDESEQEGEVTMYSRGL
jgi:hypothetical protein